MTAFCDVDGELGKTVLPIPHKPFAAATEFTKWDQVSAAERFDQIKDRLTLDQQGILLSTIVTASGAPADQLACTEILRWWALSGYDPEAYMAYVIKWKLKCGQTGLSLRIFRDALASGSLSYRFSTLVKRIDQSSGHVTVTTSDGSHHVASYLVCTIPLNTLNDVVFNPPLSRNKVLAATKGQVNLCVKAHAEVAGTDQRSWWGIAYNKRPGMMAGAFGDGLTPAGNTHLVSFSLNGAFQKTADRGFAEMKTAYEEFTSAEIKRLVSPFLISIEQAAPAWTSTDNLQAVPSLGSRSTLQRYMGYVRSRFRDSLQTGLAGESRQSSFCQCGLGGWMAWFHRWRNRARNTCSDESIYRASKSTFCEAITWLDVWFETEVGLVT